MTIGEIMKEKLTLLFFIISLSIFSFEKKNQLRPEQKLLKAYQAEKFDPQTEKEKNLNNKYDRTPASVAEEGRKSHQNSNIKKNKSQLIEKKIDSPKNNLGLEPL